MTIQALFGIAAGICAFAASGFYIFGIWKGETKPSKVTWWVLTLTNVILAASYYASGARDTVWIAVVYCIIFSITGLLSIRYGEKGWTIVDKLSLVGVVLSLCLWWFFNSPEVALYAIILVEFFGLVPTIYKSYKRPWTEHTLAWQVGTFACFLNIFAIENWTFAIAVYPFYSFLTNCIVLYFLMFPHFKKDYASQVP